jgi:hypothetical protein
VGFFVLISLLTQEADVVSWIVQGLLIVSDTSLDGSFLTINPDGTQS